MDTSGNIVTFARIKPSKKIAKNLYSLRPVDREIEFQIPKNVEDGFVNNSQESHTYSYNGGIFDVNASQEDVFNLVAKPVALTALEGYNGTIFAYGQTGSGKTFTISGGLNGYEERGLIPRTIAFLFNEINKQKDWHSKLSISYMEIYNDRGYDLLDDERNDSSKLESLPQVKLFDTMDNGRIELTGLRAPHCENEESALNQMFIGDTNRVMCETPMNDSSSRSHCIFTIYLESSKIGSAVVRNSKLHLVDLAGSERGASFKIGDVAVLEQSKHINLSLHYLEMCIGALYNQALNPSKSHHIPYRNCMLTSVLRDSLGGNCKTVMIAALSAEEKNLLESMTTCRFAQRVASIKNKAEINEDIDPKLLIKKLKGQINDLKEEIAMMKGDPLRSAASLTEEDKDRCKQLVQVFLRPDSTESLPIGDPNKVTEMFYVFKSIILGSTSIKVSNEPSEEHDKLQQVIVGLKQQIATQNNEINSLVCLLRERESASTGPISKPTQPVDNPPVPVVSKGSSSVSKPSSASSSAVMEKVVEQVGPDHTKLLIQRNSAFEEFRKSYRKNNVIADHQEQLKLKYATAKQLGVEVNSYRDKINELKDLIAQLRVEQAARGLANGQVAVDEDLDSSMTKMHQYQQVYKDKYTTLKQLKTEIEQLQMYLEKIRKELQRDFEAWWLTSVSGSGAENSAASPVRENSKADYASEPSSRTRTPITTPGLVLTGNSKADEEIQKFYRLKSVSTSLINPIQKP